MAVISLIILAAGFVMAFIVPAFTGFHREDGVKAPIYINVGYILIILGVIGNLFCVIMRMRIRLGL